MLSGENPHILEVSKENLSAREQHHIVIVVSGHHSQVALRSPVWVLVNLQLANCAITGGISESLFDLTIVWVILGVVNSES